jgi:hypothetical protein
MSTKKGRYGNPAKRRPVLYGDLLKQAQPTGHADPRELGGAISGPGGPHDRHGVVLDLTDVVLLGGIDVSVVEIGRNGALDGQMAYLLMHGRVNKTDREVSVGFVTHTDGVAAMITELLALSFRDSAEMFDDVTRRLTTLHQEKNVDLHWLKAAIDNAIDSEQD